MSFWITWLFWWKPFSKWFSLGKFPHPGFQTAKMFTAHGYNDVVVKPVVELWVLQSGAENFLVFSHSRTRQTIVPFVFHVQCENSLAHSILELFYCSCTELCIFVFFMIHCVLKLHALLDGKQHPTFSLALWEFEGTWGNYVTQQK